MDIDLDTVTHKTHMDHELHDYPQAQFRLIDAFGGQLSKFTSLLSSYLKDLGPPDQNGKGKQKSFTSPSPAEVSASLTRASSNSMTFFTTGKDNSTSNEKRGEDKDKSKSAGNRKSKGQSVDLSPDLSADKASKMKQFINACTKFYDLGKQLVMALAKQ